VCLIFKGPQSKTKNGPRKPLAQEKVDKIPVIFFLTG
jgi:hypothetical protein